jgi:aspartyl-tRNA(Asn)/glutamyl-tRNA(Gln) amidotransferase subunit A
MPAFPEDLFFATAVELNQRWQKGEFSALELVRAFSGRLESLGPGLRVLVLPLREDAARRAVEMDKERKRERFRSALQAVPYGVKDLLSVAGKPTTWGAAPFAGQVFQEDAAVITRLAKVGALLTGKLALIQLAGAGGYRYASASLTGACLNPWDRTRWSGGSSSGSAAAVAAGLVTYALGSETSGSILTPAAYCGVTGLRPTYGLVSRAGAMALSWTMDKIGPLARSAEDCGHVLQAISGAGDANRSFRFAPQYTRPARELRLGYIRTDFEESAAPPLRPALRAALEEFRTIGATLVETKLPQLPYAAAANEIIGGDAASLFQGLIESPRLEELKDPRQIAGLKAALDIPARDYLRAMRVRTLMQAKWREWFQDFDVLLTPTRFQTAPLVNEPLDSPGPPHDLIPGGNLAGWPALALPCGFAASLPVSICLVGRSFSENTLLILGLEYQRRTRFHLARPPLS